MADKVNLVSPQGNVTAIDAEAAPALEAQGWTIEGAGAEASRVTGEVLEEQYGGVTGAIGAGVEGVARGATFGLSDFVGDRGTLMRQQVNPGAALGGELLGAIAPAVFSGGTGAVGTVARLTPRGQAAARAAQWISRASTRSGAVARGIAYESAEGAGEMAINYLAQRALERGEVKAEDLARAVMRGGAVGIASGALSGSLAKLARSADGALPGAPLARSADVEAPRSAFVRKAEAGGDSISTADLAGRKATARSWDAHQELLADVRSRGRRDFLGEVDEVMRSPGVRLGLEQGDREILERALVARARDAAKAGTDAAEWSGRYARKFRGVKGDNTYVRSLGKVPRQLDDEGAVKLAALDDAMDGFDAELKAIREAGAEAEQAAITAGPEAMVAIAPSVGAKIKAAVDRVRAAPIVESAARVAGAAEAAQQLGVPVPTVSQMLGGGMVGKAVGLFLAAKAARGAVGKMMPTMAGGTPLARAVALASRHSDRVGDVIRAGLRSAAASVPARRAVASTPGAGSKIWDNARADEMRRAVASATMALPVPLADAALAQAERVSGYLAAKSPRNPMAGSPWAASWKPDAHAAADWARRQRAALDPEHAIDVAMSTPLAGLEVEALRECHPDLFGDVQYALAGLTAPELAKMRPAMREALGRSFGVPLTTGQLPGYLAPVPPAAQPQPAFARPSNANASALVTGEQVQR